ERVGAMAGPQGGRSARGRRRSCYHGVRDGGGGDSAGGCAEPVRVRGEGDRRRGGVRRAWRGDLLARAQDAPRLTSGPRGARGTARPRPRPPLTTYPRTTHHGPGHRPAGREHGRRAADAPALCWSRTTLGWQLSPRKTKFPWLAIDL